MVRGVIWTAAGGKDYAGKPRPVVVVQDDRFDGTNFITICTFTNDPTDAPLFRLAVKSRATNGLDRGSRLMVDKVTTVPKAKLGKRRPSSICFAISEAQRGHHSAREQV